MNYTATYKLPQWAESDRIMMKDFNDAFESIEDGLTQIKTTADGAATAEDLAELVTAVGSGGKTARIAWGSYTGTGTVSASNPKRLSFDFCPVLVFLGVSDAGSSPGWPATMMRPGPYGRHDSTLGDSTAHVTWENQAVSWYGANDVSGAEYIYVAVGYSNS